MRYLPREVDPLVYNMSQEDPGDVTYSEIGKNKYKLRMTMDHGPFFLWMKFKTNYYLIICQ
jgi:hypothetical protein